MVTESIRGKEVFRQRMGDLSDQEERSRLGFPSANLGPGFPSENFGLFIPTSDNVPSISTVSLRNNYFCNSLFLQQSLSATVILAASATPLFSVIQH